MSRTRHSLFDLGKTLRWSSLAAFVSHLGHGSALYAETQGDAALWHRPEAVPYIMADLIDELRALAAGLAGQEQYARYKRPSERPRAVQRMSDEEWEEWLKGVANA